MNIFLSELHSAGYKEKISEFLTGFLAKKSDEFSQINNWGKDIERRLQDFVRGGKMVRGTMLILTYKLFSDSESENVLKAATAIEIIHSSLVTHDDIMDQDLIRREKPSIFAEYTAMAQKNTVANSRHFGESMAMCFGDIGFFLSYELLSGMPEVCSLCSKELSSVVLAQMQDVYNGFSEGEISAENIMTLYTYKTGRYTFSLPMGIGGLLAGQDAAIITMLENLGEYFGVLFQLKDDEIGLLQSEQVTGKSSGSDIRENKKTYIRSLLFSHAATEEKEQLVTIFGSGKLTESDMEYVRNLYKKLRIQEYTQKIVSDLEQKAKEQIVALPIIESKKKLFYDVLQYNLERMK